MRMHGVDAHRDELQLIIELARARVALAIDRVRVTRRVHMIDRRRVDRACMHFVPKRHTGCSKDVDLEQASEGQ